MGTTIICKKILNFTRKFHEEISRNSEFCVYKKKFLGICMLHMLNCINFMEIEEKSIMQLQISMHLAQELLSYFELSYNGYRAPNRTTVCFYKKFWP